MEQSGFTVKWSDVNYDIAARWPNLWNDPPKHILHSLNGEFRAGELVVLMGPSGAGKTTFLECLIGKRVKGLTGRIQVIRQSGSGRLEMAIVPQTDNLFAQLSVKDAILWASRFKNQNLPAGKSHVAIVEEIVENLGLKSCRDTAIGQLSGGERKKVAIAQELVSRVDILFLDEPTTGLDAFSSYNLIRQLTKVVDHLSSSGRPVAMVATIHQPSSRVFNMFRRVYFLDRSGNAIYDGPPGEMIPLIESLSPDLTYEPDSNEADFITEIAAGEHDDQILKKLKNHFGTTDPNPEERNRSKTCVNELIPGFWSSLGGISLKQFASRTFSCFRRGMTINMAEHTFLVCRILSFTMLGIGIWLNNYNVDKSRDWACPDWRRDKSLWNMNYTELQEIPIMEQQILKEAKEQSVIIGSLYLFITSVNFLVITASVLVWPSEMRIMRVEVRNGWYSTASYVLGRGLADLPILMTLPFIGVTIPYLGQGFESTWYTLTMLYVVVLLGSLCMESIGQLIAACVPGGIGSVVFGIIFMFLLNNTTTFQMKIEDVTSSFLLAVIQYCPVEAMLRSVVLLLFAGGKEWNHCTCMWDLLDFDFRPDWMSCLTLPDRELDYTPSCQGIASDGTHWTLSELFQNLTFSGKYDRQVCPHQVANYSSRVMPLRSFAEEIAAYTAQPRGPRSFKPRIHHPIGMSMFHIDHDQLPAQIYQLIITVFVLRALSWICMLIKK